LSVKTSAFRAASVVAAACAASLLLSVVPAHADSVQAEWASVTSTGSLGNNAAPGGKVSRSQAISRAQDWVKEGVRYSTNGLESPYSWWADGATGGRYRQDCSGFVSMAWQLNSSRTTYSLPEVSTRINKWDLQPGDILNSNDHVVLFAGWRDKSAGTFNYYQESSRREPTGYYTDGNLYAAGLAGHPTSSYSALRYDNITENTTASTAGVYRPGESVFYVSDKGGNLAGHAGFGAQGDVPLTGDWNKDGKDTFGVYRPGTQTFLLTDDNSSVGMESTFGNPGDVPVVGDWDGDGKDTIGVYRPGDQTFYLTNDNLSVAYALKMGVEGDKPMVGDWNGDGKDTVGVYRPSDTGFYLSDSNTNAGVDHQVKFGNPGDVPVKGDWNGDGTDKVGVYRPGESDFFGAAKDSDTVIYNVRFGNPGDLPITGQW
jgi:hypothetical protein